MHKRSLTMGKHTATKSNLNAAFVPLVALVLMNHFSTFQKLQNFQMTAETMLTPLKAGPYGTCL